MGSANDPIYVLVSTHTQCPDGTTRNDTYYMTSTLNAYSAQLAANIATPVFNSVLKEQVAAGFLTLASTTATPISNDAYFGTSGGGPVSLRCEVGIGFEPLATPVRYHLVGQDVLATPMVGGLNVGGQVIYNWVDALLQRLAPVNLYQGVRFL